MAALAADPAQPVDRIELVPAAERKWLVETSNATNHPIDARATTISLFAAQVARTPDHVVVEDVMLAQNLTYAELDVAANQMAHRLRARHAERFGQLFAPDTRVGLCLERGLGLITAILAVLKAGGAYVPLDPDHPTERLSFMATDSDCALIVSDQALAARLDPSLAARLVLLDDQTSEEPSEPIASPSPTDLAYVLYTSGSTGRPKGG